MPFNMATHAPLSHCHAKSLYLLLQCIYCKCWGHLDNEQRKPITFKNENNEIQWTAFLTNRHAKRFEAWHLNIGSNFNNIRSWKENNKIVIIYHTASCKSWRKHERRVIHVREGTKITAVSWKSLDFHHVNFSQCWQIAQLTRKGRHFVQNVLRG